MVPDPGFGPDDDRRHHPEPGGRMRDSLFWELVMPEEQLAVQVYLYLSDRGRTGYNVVAWGAGEGVVELAGGQVGPEVDLDTFTLEGLSVTQPELRRTCSVRYEGERIQLAYDFVGVHDAFSYRSNPDGLPSWFAVNRLEQSGRVDGFVTVDGRRVDWQQRMGHRDHSWGTRDWAVPHHWKWFVGYTESGVAVNGWIWIAYGEWGFAGYVARDGVVRPVRTIHQHAEYDAAMAQQSLEADLVDVDGGVTHLSMTVFGVVKLPTHDPLATVIQEAGCSVTIDGEPGAGQFETHFPGPYLDHLVTRNVAQTHGPG